jgi:hypothetical protein
MTRNWKGPLLALAALALACPAPAQQSSCPPETRCSTPFHTTAACPALGECSPATPGDANPCAQAICGVCIHRGAEAFINSLMPELLGDLCAAYRAGDLNRAATLAQQALQLQPNCSAAQHADVLLMLARRLAGGAEECTEPKTTCACGADCCCARPACKCGDKCGCKASAPKAPPMPPAPPAPPAVNDPIELQCEALEIRRPVVVTSTQPASAPAPECFRPVPPMPLTAPMSLPQARAVIPAERHERARASIVTPDLRASADSVLIDGSTAYLQGHVELLINRENHPGRILTDRATVNVNDGTYEVMPAHFDAGLWKGRAKPVLHEMLSPVERGWR